MSEQASQYRGLLWLFTAVGAVCFYPAYLGSRGMVEPAYGMVGGLLAILCLFTGAYFGWKGAQIKIAERAKKADALALITMAAVLKDRSEEELEKILKKGGDAGNAARLVLERRKQGLGRQSREIPTQPEIN